jgi:hypothetical protein
MDTHVPGTVFGGAALAGLAALLLLGARPGGAMAGGPIWSEPTYPLVDVEEAPTLKSAADFERGFWVQAPTVGPLVASDRRESEARRTELKMLTSHGTLYVALRSGEPAEVKLAVALGAPQVNGYPLLGVEVEADGRCRTTREPAPQAMWRASLTEVVDPSPVKAAVHAGSQGWCALLELPMAPLGIPRDGFRMNVSREGTARTSQAAGAAPSPHGPEEPATFAWGDLWGGPFLNTYRFATVTPVKTRPQAVPVLTLPATLSVGPNRLTLSGWQRGCALLVDGREATVDTQGVAQVDIAQHGLVHLSVREPDGQEVGRYACMVPRPILIHVAEPFQADVTKPLRAEVRLDLPKDVQAEIAVEVTQGTRSVSRATFTFASGSHPVDLDLGKTQTGEVHVAVTATVPMSSKPLYVSATHWCHVGVAAATVDRFRDGIDALPTAALLRAGVADAAGYWRAVQEGAGLFSRRGNPDIWPQGVTYLLALVYQSKWRENPHAGDARFLASAVAGMEEALDSRRWQEWMNEPDNRSLQAFLLTYDLLKDDVPPAVAARWKDLLTRIVERVVETWLRPVALRYTRYSADTGTGSNHWAFHAANVYTAGRVFGRPDWLDLGAQEMRRLAAHEKDGQFAERRGVPTPSYNRLTQTALTEYLLQSGDESVRPSVVRAAEYGCRTYLVQGAPMTVHDGRVNGNPHTSGWLLPLSLTEQGRSLARTCARASIHSERPPSRTSAETWFRLAEAAANYQDGPERDWAVDGEFCYMDGLALVVRRQGFQYGLSGISLPPIESLYRLDPQNALELAHVKTGIILRGNNSQKQPEAGSFFSRPGGQPVWLPIDGLIQRTLDGHVVTLNYSRFKTRVRVRILNGNEAEVRAEVLENQGAEPVVYNVFPAADQERPLDLSADGRTLRFGVVTLAASAPVQVDRNFVIFDPYSGTLRQQSKPVRAWLALEKGKPFVLKVTVAA